MNGSKPGRRRLRVRRARYTVLFALAVFGACAAAPDIRIALHLMPAGPPTVSHGVRLSTPAALAAVPLSPVARPIAPQMAPAQPPSISPTSDAAAVGAEDTRLRTLLRDSNHIHQPQVVRTTRRARPTLVLPGGAGALPTGGTIANAVPQTYTAADLERYGVLKRLPNHAALLVDSVFITTNATLTIGGSDVQALYLDSSGSSFTSIVAWGGNLSFAGAAHRPLMITGWDHGGVPATDRGDGRSYIREMGGRMNLVDVRVSSLGFWSGRTGGVAWTGLSGKPSTGGARSSTFINDAYGAFVSHAAHAAFSADLFELNQLDGLRLHRYTIGALVTGSSAVRNGGNGFVVDRATRSSVLRGDVAEHNAGNGILVDGRPLVSGASASGNAVMPDSGTQIRNSAISGNLRAGIIIEGGTGTVIKNDEVCAQGTGISLRDGAVGTILTGNDVRCHERIGIAIGPNAPDTVVAGNAITTARIGVLIRSAGSVQMEENLITRAYVFGITIRGTVSAVSGQDNVIAGNGFRAVDTRADANLPALKGTVTTAWIYRAKVTVWSYLRFHPLSMVWLSLFSLVLIGALWSRRRRLPPHPYPQSTRVRPSNPYPQSTRGLPPHPYPQSTRVRPPNPYPQSTRGLPPHPYPQSTRGLPPHPYPQSTRGLPPHPYPQSTRGRPDVATEPGQETQQPARQRALAEMTEARW